MEPAWPAAAIMSRRVSRSAIPERLRRRLRRWPARDGSSDDEWHPDEAVGASDEEDMPITVMHRLHRMACRTSVS